MKSSVTKPAAAVEQCQVKSRKYHDCLFAVKRCRFDNKKVCEIVIWFYIKINIGFITLAKFLNDLKWKKITKYFEKFDIMYSTSISKKLWHILFKLLDRYILYR